MIVENDGYFNFDQLINLIKDGTKFSIYRTTKNTDILVKGSLQKKISLFHPKHDRLPWKLVPGKKITHNAKQIFNSTTDELKNVCLENWNNKNQIIVYSSWTT